MSTTPQIEATIVERLMTFLQQNRVSLSIVHLLMHDGKRVTEFRSKAGCSTANISHLRKTLERDGLGDIIVDPEDARFRLVRTSTKGKALVKELKEALAA